MSNQTKVVWKALEGSQELFLNTPYRETLLHGSRGGGKTETAIMAFAKHVNAGYAERWRGVIFRRAYKDLEDVISKSKRLFKQLFPDARFLAGKGDLKWVFATGEELMFRKFDSIDDYNGFHGQELPFILWEEITNWPDDSCYEIMKSCNRSVKMLDAYGKKTEYTDTIKVPRMYLSTTNPSGAGHGWVKDYFISQGDDYEPIINEVGEARWHIPSSVFENPFMDDDYIKDLSIIKDENLRKAWLLGSWDIVAGGLFSDVWNETANTCKPFDIPESWKIDRSFDWGSSKPFSVIWYAESDGTDYIDADGNEVATIAGDIFAILEYYGASGPNVGLRLTARAIAIEIRDYEMNHPLLKGRNVVAGPADSQIYTVENGSSVATSMEKIGIYWLRADKSSGSRVAGWEVIREKLDNGHNGEGLPKLVIFRGGGCKDLLRLLPVAPRDAVKLDDIDTDSEDHNLDSLRYRCRKRPVGRGCRQL
jgi:hypothetical protein